MIGENRDPLKLYVAFRNRSSAGHFAQQFGGLELVGAKCDADMAVETMLSLCHTRPRSALCPA